MKILTGWQAVVAWIVIATVVIVYWEAGKAIYKAVRYPKELRIP